MNLSRAVRAARRPWPTLRSAAGYRRPFSTFLNPDDSYTSAASLARKDEAGDPFFPSRPDETILAYPTERKPQPLINPTVLPWAKQAWPPQKFDLVPFKEENIRDVLSEVPDVRYYYIGNDDPRDYPYKDVPMTKPIRLDQPDQSSAIGAYSYKPNYEVQFSRLENGLRIASIDHGGLTSTLGLLVNTGSRYETSDCFGVSSYLEQMAFWSTAHLSWLRTIKTIEAIGASATCTAGREHIEYRSECQRKYMPIMVPLLVGNVLFPRFLSWEIKRKVVDLEYDREKFSKNPENVVGELLHTTAWAGTLGNRLFSDAEHADNFNSVTLRNFVLKHFSPDRMVFVGADVNHEEFCKWIMRAFVDYNAVPPSPREETTPVYRGGESRVPAAAKTKNPLVHLAICFETPGGWNGFHNLIPLTLLQNILGGGGAFSSGGPGKGMYTRLYQNVLSRDWVESCQTLNLQYSDTGLFGFYMAANPGAEDYMVPTLARQFEQMSEVSQEELARAKNALKAAIHMNLESRATFVEDLGRQLLMSGRVISPEELCQKIEKTSAADIRRVATSLRQSRRPTVVVYGDSSKKVPHYEKIQETLCSGTNAD